VRNEPSAGGRPGRSASAPVRVLVVDDDPIVAGSIAEFLVAEGLEAATAAGGDEAMAALSGAAQAGG